MRPHCRRRVQSGALRRIHSVALLSLLATPNVWAATGAEDLLISVQEAKSLLGKPNVRFVFGDADAAFEESHIPGSVGAFAHDFTYLDDVRKCGGLPMCPETAATFIGRTLGVDNQTRVVAYDDGKGPNATGIWFFLRLYGHDNVQIMDGGLATWRAAGNPTESGKAPPPPPKSYTTTLRKEMIVAREEVEKATQAPGYLLLDARHNLDEYMGKMFKDGLVAPGKSLFVKRGGFIPGAIFSPWTKYAANKSGKPNKPLFRSEKKLKKQLRKLEKKGYTDSTKIISYCHVGIGRATFQYLALKMAGHQDVRVYVGSWHEWGNTPGLPVGKVQ